MDLIDKKIASPAQAITAQMGSDGALDICVVPTATLSSPGYSSLAVHQDHPALAPVVASCPHAGRDYPPPDRSGNAAGRMMRGLAISALTI